MSQNARGRIQCESKQDHLLPATVLPVTGVLSPSLATRAGAVEPAYELKFLLEEARAREVEDWARRRLSLDPHGVAEWGGGYRTTTLYLDTPALDVFRNTAGFRRSKHRLRRYGSEPTLYLERKTRNGDRVRKQRSALPLEELSLLAAPLAEASWPGNWFQRRLQARGLRPAARIVYQRSAYFGGRPEAPFRLTFDRRIRGVPAREWAVPAEEDGLPLLTGRVIMEMKFRSALPAALKELVQSLRVSPTAVSKYRTCLRAWQEAAAEGTGDG